MSERDYEPKPSKQESKKDYHETASGEKRRSPYDKPEPMKPRTPPKDLSSPKERSTPYGKEGGPFTKAWDDLTKFADCPVCLGDPRACPTPDVPASVCPTRRNAIKHMKRGKGARPAMVLRD